jgi:hypothetical protein
MYSNRRVEQKRPAQMPGVSIHIPNHSDFQDALGFPQKNVSLSVLAGVVQLLALFAILDYFGPLRWRKLGSLHRRVYSGHISGVIALG